MATKATKPTPHEVVMNLKVSTQGKFVAAFQLMHTGQWIIAAKIENLRRMPDIFRSLLETAESLLSREDRMVGMEPNRSHELAPGDGQDGHEGGLHGPSVPDQLDGLRVPADSGVANHRGHFPNVPGAAVETVEGHEKLAAVGTAEQGDAVRVYVGHRVLSGENGKLKPFQPHSPRHAFAALTEHIMDSGFD